MLTFPYDQSEFPPAPYVTLQIHPSINVALVQTERAKVDSGAGVTVIPERLVQQFGLFPFGVMSVRGYDGIVRQRSTYLVDLSTCHSERSEESQPLRRDSSLRSE